MSTSSIKSMLLGQCARIGLMGSTSGTLFRLVVLFSARTDTQLWCSLSYDLGCSLVWWTLSFHQIRCF